MKKILDIISKEVMAAFEAAGYEGELGRVTISNRPDLCEYQCNGAMAGAKKYHKAPIMIANDVAGKLAGSAFFVLFVLSLSLIPFGGRVFDLTPRSE